MATASNIDPTEIAEKAHDHGWIVAAATATAAVVRALVRRRRSPGSGPERVPSHPECVDMEARAEVREVRKDLLQERIDTARYGGEMSSRVGSLEEQMKALVKQSAASNRVLYRLADHFDVPVPPVQED
jgi:hypothetical protein